MNIAGFIIMILLYANNVILIARMLHNLQDHLEALDSFCMDVGMNGKN